MKDKKKKEEYIVIKETGLKEMQEATKEYEKIIPKLDKQLTSIRDMINGLNTQSRMIAFEEVLSFIALTVKMPPILRRAIVSKISDQAKETKVIDIPKLDEVNKEILNKDSLNKGYIG